MGNEKIQNAAFLMEDEEETRVVKTYFDFETDTLFKTLQHK